MQFILIACLAAVAVAAPTYNEADLRSENREHIPILRDDRVHEDGHYSFDVETGNGIYRSEAGEPSGHEGAVNQAGQYSFTLPNGELFELKFVADENGFQPESAYLPVAPAFPHPIPDFVLEQIEKAAREDAEEAAGLRTSKSYAPPAPSSGYSP